MTARRLRLRAWWCVALALLLGGCVPLGVRVQNMFAAMLG
jgi:hypothetical protein